MGSHNSHHNNGGSQQQSGGPQQYHHHHKQGPRKSHHNILEHGLFNDSHHHHHQHGRRSPKPFESEEEDIPEGRMSGKQFHNYFYDGFYAPYILNPAYMLLIDCRDEDDYNRGHVVTAHWYGGVDLKDEKLDLSQFSLLVLYDEDGGTEKMSVVRRLQDEMSDGSGKLEPVVLHGGYAEIDAKYPYMCTSLELTSDERPNFINWYPSIVEENCLYLGRADHALSLEVVDTLRVTHIVNLTSSTPNVFPSVSYLCFPVTDTKDAKLLHYFAEIAKRIENVIKSGGRVLVHCDQGVNASATVIIAYVMYVRNCTLEDAHYFVKSLRPVIQPSEHFLEQLSKFEVELFGKKITNTDDLWF